LFNAVNAKKHVATFPFGPRVISMPLHKVHKTKAALKTK